MRKLCGLLLALALLPSVANASLITNGGFETGSFAGWTQVGNTGFTGVSGGAYAHTGLFGGQFGAVGSLGGISQSVVGTVAGGTYQLSFWLRNIAGTPNEFKATWDGTTTVTHLVNAGAFSYTQYTYNLIATSSTTTVEFLFRHDPQYYGLDDVSLDLVSLPVPVPAGVVMAGMGIVCLGGFNYLRRRRAALSV